MDLTKYAGLQIKRLRTNAGLTQSQLAEKLGITKSAVSGYETGYRMPKQDFLFEIAEFFNVSINYFFPKNETIVDKTLEIINQLQPFHQEEVYSYAKERLKNQNKNTTTKPEINPHYEEISEEHNVIDYGLKSAAGVGVLNGDTFENTITVPMLPDSNYDYPITVNGDSMEPMFYDGDIAFVKKQNYLDHNEIGIFETENGTVIKKLYKVPNEQVKLNSLNPKYHPITDGVKRVIGKVVK